MKEIHVFAKFEIGGLFMEFLGLSNGDFDFFKKKDKMSKMEYEKRRYEVKLHFRSLCYEIQKIYHKKTEGVLEINKEFQNFNKRSINITAEYGDKTNILNKYLEMNTENLCVKLVLASHNEEDSSFIIDLVRNKKDIICEYIMANKYNAISCSFKGKSNKIESIKYNAIEINTKNYDAFVSFIEDNISKGKFQFEVIMQYTYPKNEVTKQSKNLSNIIYEVMINTGDIYSKLC